MSEQLLTRRTVSGIAFRACDYCGRSHADKKTKVPENYQYRADHNSAWEKGVYCSKLCRNAWTSMNGA